LEKFIKIIKDEIKEKIEDYKASLELWYIQIDEWKKAHKLDYDRNATTIKPQYVIEKVYEVFGDNVIIATEVGQNQMWAAQFFPFKKPRTLLTSGGLGTMGYGFPAAIGAQIAFPDKTVIDIAGDGSIQMNIQEFATAMQYKLPVKIVILNNGYLGMVRQWQELFFDKNYSETVMEVQPDFVKLAESFGAVGFRATTKDEVLPVLKEAASIKLPVLMDFHVEREENVYPMVPAGAPINKMLLV